MDLRHTTHPRSASVQRNDLNGLPSSSSPRYGPNTERQLEYFILKPKNQYKIRADSHPANAQFLALVCGKRRGNHLKGSWFSPGRLVDPVLHAYGETVPAHRTESSVCITQMTIVALECLPLHLTRLVTNADAIQYRTDQAPTTYCSVVLSGVVMGT